MKVLLGGIPLGCDNIGDEAIIAGAVATMRTVAPGADVTVATADPNTAGLLGVSTVPAYGFVQDAPIGAFASVVKDFDAYVWAGATGLSDYPDTALDLLEAAQGEGVATFVWGVGMDSELNPAFFKASGCRRRLLALFNAVGLYEGFLRHRLARRLRRILPRCKGIWLRDWESRDVLSRFGVSSNVHLTADSALFIPRPEPAGASEKTRPRLGLCLSAQRVVADTEGAKSFVRRLSASVDVVGIPMNPKTDAPLMRELGVGAVADTRTPEDVMRAAGDCDLILSSRLHLLILAANVGVPVMGIARGSKLANFLDNIGERVVGSVGSCEWDGLAGRILEKLSDAEGLKKDFIPRRDAAYKRLAERLEHAREEFKARLARV